MALPKEPRQQMINMMYLVLIALLAMNVSKEVLKAFRMVQLSIDRSNDQTEQKIENLYGKLSFEMQNDPKRAKEYFIKANLVKKYCGELNDFMDDLQKICESKGSGDGSSGGSAYQDRGQGIGELAKADDNEIGSEVLIFKKKGFELQDRINSTRHRLLQLVDSADRKNFILALSPAEDVVTNDGKEPWVNNMFEGMPLAAVVTMITKLKSDLKSTEVDLLTHLLKKLGEFGIQFDVLEPQVIANSNYLNLGEQYRSSIFVSAYSSTQKPMVYLGELDTSFLSINEQTGKYNATNTSPLASISDSLQTENGKGILESLPEIPGKQSYEGAIKLKLPNGNSIYFPFKSDYTVGNAGVVASADKLNLLYVGIDNELTLSVPGFPPGRVRGSISQGTLIQKGNGKFIAQVGNAGLATINISVVDDKGVQKVMGSKRFRVKRVPKPLAKVAKMNGGRIRAAKFRAQLGIIAELENFVYEGISYKITSYELLYVGQRADGIASAPGRGVRFTGDVRKFIDKAEPGDLYTFTGIRAKGPGGITKLSDITFRIN